ncbi:hypothetical protein M885DRAFT_141408 [Pelagophyceae sp. CCMP2097]|nr:hypothetical protein M885DRAFT_141408 [Pelagophyceae sp. CCMP2097]
MARIPGRAEEDDGRGRRGNVRAPILGQIQKNPKLIAELLASLHRRSMRAFSAWASVAWVAGRGAHGSAEVVVGVEVDDAAAARRGASEQRGASDALDWLRRSGGSAVAVDVGDFGTMGKGLRCTQSLSEDGQVFHMPANVIFHGPALSKKFGLAQDDAIAVALLAEVALGDASAWAPYLRALPIEVTTLASFGDLELAQLQDDRLAARGLSARAAAAASFQNSVAVLSAAVAEACGGCGAPTEKDWGWAKSIPSERRPSSRRRRGAWRRRAPEGEGRTKAEGRPP